MASTLQGRPTASQKVSTFPEHRKSTAEKVTLDLRPWFLPLVSQNMCRDKFFIFFLPSKALFNCSLPRSSGSRIVLLTSPSRTGARRSSGIEAFVPEYSGGAAPVSHRFPLKQTPPFKGICHAESIKLQCA
jgi:hypothetical protein